VNAQAKAAVAAIKPAAPRADAANRPGGPKGALPPAPGESRVHGVKVPASPPRQFGQPAAALAAAKLAAQKTMLPRQQPVASKQAVAAAAPAPASKKPVNQRHGFKTNEWIVYPAHGVGRIVGIEEQEIAGMSLELFVITFEKDKMTLRVPTGKSASVGMRKLADEGVVKRAMETLKGRARIKRTMWSRRAQEYEAKINSGDLVAIAEVVRDLYRSESQPEQSYSERQLYEAALDRMAREIAAVEKLDERGAVQRITEVLSKSAKGRRAAAEEAEVKAA
jgi:CarD family transcriptional regulator